MTIRAHSYQRSHLRTTVQNYSLPASNNTASSTQLVKLKTKQQSRPLYPFNPNSSSLFQSKILTTCQTSRGYFK